MNCPPSIPLLPPQKSKRRGRPRTVTIKNALDIALKKIIEKNRKLKKENVTEGRNEDQIENPNKKKKRKKRNQKKKIFRIIMKIQRRTLNHKI